MDDLPHDVRSRLSSMGCLHRSPPEGAKPARRRIEQVGWMTDAAVVTLTEDHWLRAFSKSGDETGIVHDFSESLNKYGD